MSKMNKTFYWPYAKLKFKAECYAASQHINKYNINLFVC